ncbi:hypothetical protein HNQ57_001108 [Zhongshania antarctica]|uniref:Uncharacterized protein n=1 Tax=Zhongshania antarctica TaxID=641702 RepID=A0A840R1B7_9GAMM|nr:hypothetical protein [Zhongshania antarctica]MBB5186845.1 hypothetical protein [Zhongshania antarctica]
MTLSSSFECWRVLNQPTNSWGLAWFLAAELCRRFYSSHGLVPWVIERGGLGYYGIEINHVRCGVHSGALEPLGRFTAGGNVENWRRGGPGDHGLNLMDECLRGAETAALVHAAVAYFELPPIPLTSHISCRHKRWGDSYVLCFEVAAYLAMQYEGRSLAIWNHPFRVNAKLNELDAKASMPEHLGGFLFVRDGREILLAGDGRVLDGSGSNLWLDYMMGQSVSALAQSIERRLAG